MLRIAVCDDNQDDLSKLVSMINEELAARADRHTVECTAFSNAVDLLAVIEGGQSFDLVLLDIIMPFTTGMDAAKEIRQFNKEIKIVFLTSSPEFAVESYSVEAYFYALKPTEKAAVKSILNKFFSDIEDQTDNWFLVKSKTGLIRVYFDKLEFAEVIGRTIIYHLSDGSALEAAGSIIGLEKLLLPESGFIKPHRSYIVNMAHIDTLSQRQIKMRSQTVVPMSKANFNATKAAYMSFAFHKL